MWEGIDKRRFPRIKHRCMIRVSGYGKEKVFDTFTENIGAGGICVVLDREVDLFKNAKLELYLTDKDSPISCKGTIVWVIRRRLGSQGKAIEYDVGIEFIDISDMDRKRISGLVDSLLGGELDNGIYA